MGLQSSWGHQSGGRREDADQVGQGPRYQDEGEVEFLKGQCHEMSVIPQRIYNKTKSKNVQLPKDIEGEIDSWQNSFKYLVTRSCNLRYICCMLQKRASRIFKRDPHFF